MSQTRSSTSAWTFLNEVFGFEGLYQGSRADSFTGATDAGGHCGFLAS